MGKVSGVIALALLGGGLWVFAFEERATYTYCRQCGTDVEEHEYGLGPLTLWSWSETSPSLPSRDLLDASHAHEWQFASSWSKSALCQSIG